MENDVTNGLPAEIPAIPGETSQAVSPAPGAEEQKPNAPDPESEVSKPETPEQIEAKRQSRRARARERDAASLAAAQTEARIYREQLERLRSSEPKAELPAEPVRDQYETLEDYTKALVEFKAEQVVSKRLQADHEARQRQESQVRETQSAEKITKDWSRKEEEFAKTAKDYQEVVGALIEDKQIEQLHEWAKQAILESGVGPQVLYHLANNPEEADRIAGLPKTKQVSAIESLEEKVSAKAPKKVSGAPEPGDTVRGGRSANPGISERDSQSEYEAKRKQQGARWAH